MGTWNKFLEHVSTLFFNSLNSPVGLLVTPTDRPKSVRNRCVIEVFGGVCVCCPLVFEFSVGIGGFVIGLGQISFFFSCKLAPSAHLRYFYENSVIANAALVRKDTFAPRFASIK